MAIQVNKLPAGTVVFEDISKQKYRGKVIKPVAQKLSPRGSSQDTPLSGVIEFNDKSDTKEVLFGDRDTQGDIQLRTGDTVEFNTSTGTMHSVPRLSQPQASALDAILLIQFYILACLCLLHSIYKRLCIYLRYFSKLSQTMKLLVSRKNTDRN